MDYLSFLGALAAPAFLKDTRPFKLLVKLWALFDGEFSSWLP